MRAHLIRKVENTRYGQAFPNQLDNPAGQNLIINPKRRRITLINALVGIKNASPINIEDPSTMAFLFRKKNCFAEE